MSEADIDIASLRSAASSGSWTLESDMNLQRYLQQFSAKIGVKTKGLVDKVDSLNNDTSEADVKLRNTFNEFLMMANTQFIENVSLI